MANLITENQLDDWARSHAEDAQGLVVELVYRLVAASCPNPIQRRFPLGDSLGQPGPDGTLNTRQGYAPFVPEERSLWEIGTGLNAGRKATLDYRCLTASVPEEEREQSTFVFLTPMSGRRGWSFTWRENAQASWLAQRRGRNEWKGVEVIDGTKLTDWLHQFPAVEAWLARDIFGSQMRDVIIPEQRWAELQSYGDHGLSPELFILDRDAAKNKLQSLFGGKFEYLNLNTHSPVAAVDFVCAFLASLDEDMRTDFAGRAVIVSSFEAWDTLCETRERLVLIADPSMGLSGEHSSRAIQRAHNAGHSVINCDPSASPGEHNVRLPNPSIPEIVATLIATGYSSQRSQRLAIDSGGRISSLLRLLQGLPISPDWATGPDAADFATAMLLGYWSDDSETDRAVIETVTVTNYTEWSNKVRRLSRIPGSPITHRDDTWRFISRRDGWYALGSNLYNEDLGRLEEVAITVLKEKDPKFELPPSERYLAVLVGKVPSHSFVLRKGLAETLALLGSHPDALSECSRGRPQYVASRAVADIFHDADWELWASLDELLPDLAEAAPDQFLSAVEASLQRDPCPFDEIFRQENEGQFPENYSKGLLWALETLVWDERFLVRACVLLGELAHRHPKDGWENNPLRSLTTILLPWLPRTTAPLDKRIVAIETLQREVPDVAWRLILNLLPGQTESSTPTRLPSWQDFVPDDWREEVGHREYSNQVSAYSCMAVEMAKGDVDMLSNLIAQIHTLTQPAFDQALAYLTPDAIPGTSEEQMTQIWTELTICVRDHKRFHDAHWALGKANVAKIERVAAQFSPHGPAIRKMIFSYRDAALYDGNQLDWEEIEQQRVVRRKDAIEAIMAEEGLGAVIHLAEQVEDSTDAGQYLADIANSEIDESLLPSLLETDDENLQDFIKGYAWGRRRNEGWEWLDELDKSNWSESQIGRLLSILPFEEEAWQRVANWIDNSEAEYWQKTGANPYNENCDLNFAIGKLLEHDRFKAAMRCMYMLVYRGQLPEESQAVTALVSWMTTDEPPQQTDQYRALKVIAALQDNPQRNSREVMRVESANLRLFDIGRGSSPKILQEGLASNPDIFCQLIQFLCLPEEEDSQTEPFVEVDSAARRHVRSLLHVWQTPPGMRPDGTLDAGEFCTWLREVRETLSEGQQMEAAEYYLGKVLIHSPADPDGLWIHRAVGAALNDRHSEVMRQSYHEARFNSRGPYFVDPTGGAEQTLADQFNREAEDVENAGFHRLAAELRRISESYSLDARSIGDAN